MIDLSNWAWPQITYAILLLVSGGLMLAYHGREREGKYNVFTWLIMAALTVTILLYGGFFA